jgi:hypothetical protein
MVKDWVFHRCAPWLMNNQMLCILLQAVNAILYELSLAAGGELSTMREARCD